MASIYDRLVEGTMGLVKGLPEHLQDTEQLAQLGLPAEDYNVISAMNAADNMNAGLSSLIGPGALYTLGDTIFDSTQSLPEGISDFGRYMKGVNIQSNPELAKQLMGQDYVNQMQGKYALAMDAIGKGIFGKGPDPSIYGSPSNTDIMSTSYTDKIMDPGLIIEAAKNREILNKQGLLSLDDAGLTLPDYEEFAQKAKPGLNLGFAKQAGKGLLSLLTKNPFIKGIGGLLGLLGDRANLPGTVGGQDLRGDTGLDTFRRSTSLADFFQRRRDQKAREEAVKIGTMKQAAQNLDYEYDAYGGGNGGVSAPGSGAHGMAGRAAGGYQDL